MAGGGEYVVSVEFSVLELDGFRKSLEKMTVQMCDIVGRSFSVLVYNQDGYIIIKSDEMEKADLSCLDSPQWKSFDTLKEYLNQLSLSSKSRLHQLLLYRGRTALPEVLSASNSVWKIIKPFVDDPFGKNYEKAMSFSFSDKIDLVGLSVIGYVKKVEVPARTETETLLETEHVSEQIDNNPETVEVTPTAEAGAGCEGANEELPAVIEAETFHAPEDPASVYKVALARHQGVSHISKRVPCQDYTATYTQGDITTAVLCDGAGSAKYAEEGAELIAEGMARILTEHCDELFEGTNGQIADILFPSVQVIIRAEVEKTGDGRTVADYNATFLSVTIKGDKAVIIHVGDGIVISRTENGLKALSRPENGEMSNETFFVTNPASEGYMDVARKKLPDGPFAFVLMSDGSERSFYSRGQDKLLSLDLLNELIDCTVDLPQEVADKVLYTYLKHEITKVSRDDCSLCIVARRDDSHILTRLGLSADGCDPADIRALILDCEKPVKKSELVERYTALGDVVEKLIADGLLIEEGENLVALGCGND